MCKFTYLRTRCLLDLQRQIQELEDQLLPLDEKERRPVTPPQEAAENPENNVVPPQPASDKNSGADVVTKWKTREELMSLIQEKLRVYGDLAEQQHKMISYGRLLSLGLYNIAVFAKRFGLSLDPNDYQWLVHAMDRKDLASLSSSGPSTIWNFIAENFVKTIPLRLDLRAHKDATPSKSHKEKV